MDGTARERGGGNNGGVNPVVFRGGWIPKTEFPDRQTEQSQTDSQGMRERLGHGAYAGWLDRDGGQGGGGGGEK